MISTNSFNFLIDLTENNNREWFNLNKQRYTQALDEMIGVTSMLIHEIEKFDTSITGLEAKKCIFRIYRDVRFSKDKVPYKNHFGIFFSPNGKNSSMPGYYLHIQPDESFLGGGVWMPDAKELFATRQEIYYNYDTFRKIIDEPAFAKEFPELDHTHKNIKFPKGFDPTFEGVDIIKHKSFFFAQKFTNEQLMAPNAKEKVVELLKKIHPFNSFMRTAFEEI